MDDLPSLSDLVTLQDPRAGRLEVFDKSTGDVITYVKALHIKEGWVERYISDQDGKMIPRGDECATERLHGDFGIRPAPLLPS